MMQVEVKSLEKNTTRIYSYIFQQCTVLGKYKCLTKMWCFFFFYQKTGACPNLVLSCIMPKKS